MAKPATHRPMSGPHKYKLTQVPLFDNLIQIRKRIALKTAVLGSRRTVSRAFLTMLWPFKIHS